MAQIDYIPAGRTSRIVRGSMELQIQTEYACRPNPRLTTSVFNGGKVVHKIEQELGLPISSQEDMLKVEGLLCQQHSHVLEIADSEDFETYIQTHRRPAPAPIQTARSLLDRLRGIAEIEKVFRIDNNGEFESESISEEFRKKFSAIFRNLRELIEIFQRLPGGKREGGIYAVEHGRLYLLSAGYECYFVLTNRNCDSVEIEKKIQSAITG